MNPAPFHPVVPVLTPGVNCWRLAAFDRAAVLIDAAGYYEHLAEAIRRAERSVLILGWDIHSRVCVERDHGRRTSFSALLAEATGRHAHLEVRILVWNFSPILAFERELLPQLQFALRTGDRVELSLASDHPTGASHHQKVVVIDDALAFVGGIDIATHRWDRPGHALVDPLRRTPDGTAFRPFHDVQLAVDGEAAAVLGELARERWRESTGERLEPVRVSYDPWPLGLPVDIAGERIAIARTRAPYGERPAVAEVERLYLDSIRAARRFIYIENQYLTCMNIAEALADRLLEASGPEVVVITPLTLSGRLEEATMGPKRQAWVQTLMNADRHRRLRVLTPVSGRDDPLGVNVHAKVMIVDDRILRIGSSNLSNRSMRLDTECDGVVELGEDDPRITQVRARLLADHLGTTPEEVLQVKGTLLNVVDELGTEERVRPFETWTKIPARELAGTFADPLVPVDEALVSRALPLEAATEGSRRVWLSASLVLVCIAMAALWAWTPLSDWARPKNLVSLAAPLRGSWTGALLALPLFIALALAMVPITLLIVSSVLLFNPLVGGILGVVGALSSALLGFGMGRWMLRDTVKRIAGTRLRGIDEKLGETGLWAVTALRVIPVAPFALINLVCGSSSVRWRDFALASTIGLVPGILAMVFAADRVTRAVREPEFSNVLWAALASAGILAVLVGLRRLFGRLRS